MSLIAFIGDKKLTLFTQLAAILFSGILLLLTRANRDMVIYTVLILLAALVFSYGYEFRKKSAYYKDVLEYLDGLDQKYLLAELTEEADFIEGKIMQDCLRQCNKSMHDAVSEYKLSAKEYREFIELWIHEVKTPIASAKLTIENNENEITKSLEEDFLAVEAYLDQALYYARSSSVETDYIVQKVTLEEIVNRSVRSNSKSLIKNRVSIKKENLDHIVYTDTKWMQFILQQIIQNSIKYASSEPCLCFYGTEHTNSITLSIKDNGIGISAKDLPRIFEKGYTGTSGRSFSAATGIGLYLCRKLCQKLGLSVTAKSAVNEGTTISIHFPRSSMFENIVK